MGKHWYDCSQKGFNSNLHEYTSNTIFIIEIGSANRWQNILYKHTQPLIYTHKHVNNFDDENFDKGHETLTSRENENDIHI